MSFDISNINDFAWLHAFERFSEQERLATAYSTDLPSAASSTAKAPTSKKKYICLNSYNELVCGNPLKNPELKKVSFRQIITKITQIAEEEWHDKKQHLTSRKTLFVLKQRLAKRAEHDLKLNESQFLVEEAISLNSKKLKDHFNRFYSNISRDSQGIISKLKEIGYPKIKEVETFLNIKAFFDQSEVIFAITNHASTHEIETINKNNCMYRLEKLLTSIDLQPEKRVPAFEEECQRQIQKLTQKIKLQYCSELKILVQKISTTDKSKQHLLQKFTAKLLKYNSPNHSEMNLSEFHAFCTETSNDIKVMKSLVHCFSCTKNDQPHDKYKENFRILTEEFLADPILTSNNAEAITKRTTEYESKLKQLEHTISHFDQEKNAFHEHLKREKLKIEIQLKDVSVLQNKYPEFIDTTFTTPLEQMHQKIESLEKEISNPKLSLSHYELCQKQFQHLAIDPLLESINKKKNLLTKNEKLILFIQSVKKDISSLKTVLHPQLKITLEMVIENWSKAINAFIKVLVQKNYENGSTIEQEIRNLVQQMQPWNEQIALLQQKVDKRKSLLTEINQASIADKPITKQQLTALYEAWLKSKPQANKLPKVKMEYELLLVIFGNDKEI